MSGFLLAAAGGIAGWLLFRGDPSAAPADATEAERAAADVPVQREPNPNLPVQTKERSGGADEKKRLQERFEAALQIDDGDERRLALAELAEAAASDLEVARALTEQLLARPGKEARSDAHQFVTRLVEVRAKTDPAAVASWIGFLPPDIKLAAMHGLGREWAAGDVGGLIGWFDQITEEKQRSTVIRSATQTLEASGGTDPGSAAERWAVHVSGARKGQRYSDVIAKLWAKSDPQAAYDWVARMEEPDFQSRGFLGLAEALAQADPKSAAGWVEKFPEGDVRNRAMIQTALQWAQREPAGAAAWVERVNDKQIMESTFHAIGSAWLRQDPAAATEWIGKANVPESAKRYLEGL